MRLFIALPALLMLGAAAAPVEDHGGKIDWVRDTRIGLSRAKVEGRAMMLYFTATW